MSLLPTRAAVAVFLAFACAYLFAGILRGIIATLSPTLTQEFALQARDLGLLAGGYFLGFALTQLPLGRWLDRHGPKKVVLGFLVIAVLGCLAFALANGFAALLAARILCGVGVSACLMAALTGYRRWLAPSAQLRANSWMLMTNSLGLLVATLPVQWLMPIAGWRPLFWGLALCLLASMAVLAWTVPGWAAAPAGAIALPVPETERRAGYAEVWRNPYFRRMTPVGFFSYGGMLAVQTLWAGPWLTRVAGYDALEAAAGLFTINASMLAVFWAWGAVNPWLARNGWPAERLVAWGLPTSLLMLAIIIIAGRAAGAGALALFCVCTTFMSLAQPAVGMAFAPQLAGRALSAYNLVIFAGVFTMQWGIGAAVDSFGAMGLSVADAFRAAMAVLLALSLAAYAYFMLGNNRNR